MLKTSSLVPVVRFATDGQTDGRTRDDSKYRAVTASLGNNGTSPLGCGKYRDHRVCVFLYSHISWTILGFSGSPDESDCTLA